MESGGKINVREGHKLRLGGNLQKSQGESRLNQINSLSNNRFKGLSKNDMAKRLYGLSGPYAYENT